MILAPMLLLASLMQPGAHRVSRWTIHNVSMLLMVLIVFRMIMPSCVSLGKSQDRFCARQTWCAKAAQTAADEQKTSMSSGAICNGLHYPRPAAVHKAVGHVNYGVGLELKADISIPGACEINLPIQVV